MPLSSEKLQALKELDYEKFKAEVTKNMTRNEKRNIDRELDKMKSAFKALTPTQHKLIDAIANEKANEKMDKFNYIMDRAISAYFILKNPELDMDEISKMENELAELITEDISKDNKLFDNYKGDFEMVKKALNKMELELKDRVYQLLNEGVAQKEINETLILEFPKLSKSMIANGVKKSKEMWKEEQAVKNTDPEEAEIDEAVKYIFDDSKEPKRTAKTLSEAKQESVEKTEKIVEESKEVVEEVKMNSLKVKSMVMELEGENGEYKASKDGVILVRENAQIDFKNIEELEKWTSEVKEVFKMVGGVA